MVKVFRILFITTLVHILLRKHMHMVTLRTSCHVSFVVNSVVCAAVTQPQMPAFLMQLYNGHSSIDTNCTSSLVISSQQRVRIDTNRSKAIAIKHSKRIAAHAAWPQTQLPASPEQNENGVLYPLTSPEGNNSLLRKGFHFGATSNSQELTRHKSLVSTQTVCTSTG